MSPAPEAKAREAKVPEAKAPAPLPRRPSREAKAAPWREMVGIHTEIASFMDFSSILWNVECINMIL